MNTLLGRILLFASDTDCSRTFDYDFNFFLSHTDTPPFDIKYLQVIQQKDFQVFLHKKEKNMAISILSYFEFSVN